MHNSHQQERDRVIVAVVLSVDHTALPFVHDCAMEKKLSI